MDIQAEHILWCKQNLSAALSLCRHHDRSPSAVRGQYFDLIYAGSVFTHIDDLVDSWLLELRRTLKPGGRLYVTIHDDTSVWMSRNELREHPARRQPRLLSGIRGLHGPEFAAFTIGRSEGSQVFYDLDYFCGLARPLYRVLAAQPRAYGHQTAVLLQKPEPDSGR